MADAAVSDIPDEWAPIMCPPDSVSLFDYDGIKVPCLILDDERYDGIVQSVMGRHELLDTNLDIFDDLNGRVFVQITVGMPRATDANVGMHSSGPAARGTNDAAGASDRRHERFMLDARTHLEFFEALADATMLAFRAAHAHETSDSTVTMIQLPNPDRTAHALDLIQKGLRAAT